MAASGLKERTKKGQSESNKKQGASKLTARSVGHERNPHSPPVPPPLVFLTSHKALSATPNNEITKIAFELQPRLLPTAAQAPPSARNYSPLPPGSGIRFYTRQPQRCASLPIALPQRQSRPPGIAFGLHRARALAAKRSPHRAFEFEFLLVVGHQKEPSRVVKL